ncbi:unnamed protein product [Paramecium pentaurelia]|uniref:Tetratricopeptide repeat protein n=1 Tax=Paramecium pentaurelia TaxID=43138 RepID=A0A8S1U021_9CILI|nr:unnamed protein product [Paramecium pentaurelia]
MKQQSLFMCQDITHEGEVIQGFCLNLGCQDSRSQFCLQCGVDPMKHSICRKDLKGFGQIQNFITKFNQYIIDLINQFNKQYSLVKKKYEESTKQLENIKLSLQKISDSLNQQDYQQIKNSLQMIKECYQFSNNQEKIMKQNQIGTQLLSIKRMIQALEQDQGKQQIIIQDNGITLEQGIELLNQKKWQEANDKITEYLKILEKQSSLATFFLSISLIEMNQPGKGMILREQAKKINSNLFRDLLDYSDLELQKNSQNSFILIAKSYALNDENKYKLAIEQCEKVLKDEPSHLHALYRKSFSLQDLNQHSQSISCIDKALNYDSKYSIGYIVKGNSLNNLSEYKNAIVCYDQAIKIDPNYAQVYFNKGISLANLGEDEDAIVCYDQAIQLDPNYAQAYFNKGYLLIEMKKYQSAIENYEQALLYCKLYQNEFKQLIGELRIKK